MTSISSVQNTAAANPVDSSRTTTAAKAASAAKETTPFNLNDMVDISDAARAKFKEVSR
jgi:hypothetical protein